MKIINRWNYKTHKYDEIKYDDKKYNYQYFCNNMDEKINCPHCNKELKFGDSYTSLEFHTPITGFGYGVCEKCYMEERKERYKNKKKECEYV